MCVDSVCVCTVPAGMPEASHFSKAKQVCYLGDVCLLSGVWEMAREHHTHARSATPYQIDKFTYSFEHKDVIRLFVYCCTVVRVHYDDDDVSFYNSTASSWTLATPRTTWE